MYIFSYFKTEDESMYLAVSKDGYRWEEFNNGEPVLVGEVGTKQVRDPFVYADGAGRFHAVWTDGWESRSVGYAYSDNLKDWHGQKLLPVMEDIEGAVNTWAPEIFYDKAQGKHRIIWSSTVLEEGEEKKRDHRIWSALTGDFSEVELASLFFDPGYNVIDACVVDLGDRYFMAFKDERGTNEPNTEFKATRSCYIEQSGADRPNHTEPSELFTPRLSEGPSLYSVGEGEAQHWVLIFDKFKQRRYGAVKSEDLKHWEDVTDRMEFVKGLRHGSVIRGSCRK